MITLNNMNQADRVAALLHFTAVVMNEESRNVVRRSLFQNDIVDIMDLLQMHTDSIKDLDHAVGANGDLWNVMPPEAEESFPLSIKNQTILRSLKNYLAYLRKQPEEVNWLALNIIDYEAFSIECDGRDIISIGQEIANFDKAWDDKQFTIFSGKDAEWFATKRSWMAVAKTIKYAISRRSVRSVFLQILVHL